MAVHTWPVSSWIGVKTSAVDACKVNTTCYPPRFVYSPPITSLRSCMPSLETRSTWKEQVLLSIEKGTASMSSFYSYTSLSRQNAESAIGITHLTRSKRRPDTTAPPCQVDTGFTQLEPTLPPYPDTIQETP